MLLFYSAPRPHRAAQPRLRLQMLRRIALGLLCFVATTQYATALTTTALAATSPQELLAPFKDSDLLETAFRDGVTAYEVGDYTLAVRNWQMPADRGHAGAQFSIGVAYA